MSDPVEDAYLEAEQAHEQVRTTTDAQAAAVTRRRDAILALKLKHGQSQYRIARRLKISDTRVGQIIKPKETQ